MYSCTSQELKIYKLMYWFEGRKGIDDSADSHDSILFSVTKQIILTRGKPIIL